MKYCGTCRWNQDYTVWPSQCKHPLNTTHGQGIPKKKGMCEWRRELKCGNCVWFDLAATVLTFEDDMEVFGSKVSDGQCKAIDDHTVTVVFDTKKCKRSYRRIERGTV